MENCKEFALSFFHLNYSFINTDPIGWLKRGVYHLKKINKTSGP